MFLQGQRAGLAAALSLMSCSSSDGQEGQPCYPNATCNAGLTCLSGRCVALPDGGAVGGADAGDVPRDSGVLDHDGGARDAGPFDCPSGTVFHTSGAGCVPESFVGEIGPALNAPCGTIADPATMVRLGRGFGQHMGLAPGLDYRMEVGDVVHSPVQGTVIATSNDLPGRPDTSGDVPAQCDERAGLGVCCNLLDGFGNHIVVRDQEFREWIVAHLAEGSVVVSTGDVVRAGQPVALVGNSGWTCGTDNVFGSVSLRDRDGRWVDFSACPREVSQGLEPIDCRDDDFDLYGVGTECWSVDCDDANASLQSWNEQGRGCLGELEGGEACLDRDGDGYRAGASCDPVDEDCDDFDATLHVGCQRCEPNLCEEIAGGQTCDPVTGEHVTCVDQAGCRRESNRQPCPAADPRCDAAAGSCEPCLDSACQVAGIGNGPLCDGGVLASCVTDPLSGCFEVATSTTCGSGNRCRLGACEPCPTNFCQDGQLTSGTFCTGERAYTTCGADADGCGVEVTVADCPAGAPVCAQDSSSTVACEPCPDSVCSTAGVGSGTTCDLSTRVACTTNPITQCIEQSGTLDTCTGRLGRCFAGQCTTSRIAAGRWHTCVLTGSGAVRCWGASDQGQLGYGATNVIGDEPTDVLTVDVQLGGPALELAAGGDNTCVLQAGGVVRCWGRNTFGNLGLGDTNNRGDAAGEMPPPPVPLGGPAVRVTVGEFHACALMASGAVRCWGFGGDGRLGRGDEQSIGDQSSDNMLFDINVGGTVSDIFAGGYHTCALLTSGQVRCWGRGYLLGSGQTSNVGDEPNEMPPPPVLLGPSPSFVAVGTFHACAQLGNGEVRCWGDGYRGQLGFPEMSYYGDQSSEVITSSVPLGQPALTVAAGDVHSCAIMQDNTLRCWGDGAFGKLGYGNEDTLGDDPTDILDVPVPLSHPVIDVAVGFFHTCVIVSTGAARCWGYGHAGRLGYGNTMTIGNTPMSTAANAGDVPVF